MPMAVSTTARLAPPTTVVRSLRARYASPTPVRPTSFTDGSATPMRTFICCSPTHAADDDGSLSRVALTARRPGQRCRVHGFEIRHRLPCPPACRFARLIALATGVTESAKSVLPVFEAGHPEDRRPRAAIEAAWAFAHGAARTNLQRVAALDAHRAACCRHRGGPACSS